jgi:hypothetical protein
MGSPFSLLSWRRDGFCVIWTVRPLDPLPDLDPQRPLMRIMRSVTTVLLATLTYGCGGDDAGPARAADRQVVNLDSIFTLDLSTPDRALREHWRLDDLANASNLEQDSTSEEGQFSKRWFAARRSLTTGEALEALATEAEPETFSREVLDVDLQTETRAVVLARIRNTTPIPPGAVVSDSDLKARREGAEFRYIFEKDQAGWKLSQVQRRQETVEDIMAGRPGTDWANVYDRTEVFVPRYVSP